jgi:hypothetical protein
MTKNNIITNSHKINILKQNITTQVTKESKKLSLYSTKVNIRHTKEPSVFNISLKRILYFNLRFNYCKMQLLL